MSEYSPQHVPELTPEEITQLMDVYEAAKPSFKHTLTIPAGLLTVPEEDDWKRTDTKGPIWTYMLVRKNPEKEIIERAIFIQDGYHRYHDLKRSSKNPAREPIEVIKRQIPM